MDHEKRSITNYKIERLNRNIKDKDIKQYERDLKTKWRSHMRMLA